MRWHQFGDGGGGHHWVGLIMMIVLAALVVWLIVSLTRRPGWRHEQWQHAGPPSPPSRPASAEQLLADRLARGEIDVADYTARIDALRAKPPQA